VWKVLFKKLMSLMVVQKSGKCEVNGAAIFGNEFCFVFQRSSELISKLQLLY